jgi:hypothetical protein
LATGGAGVSDQRFRGARGKAAEKAARQGLNGSTFGGFILNQTSKQKGGPTARHLLRIL